eukprot:PhM_4_TR16965/c0_g1_i1/m.22320
MSNTNDHKQEAPPAPTTTTTAKKPPVPNQIGDITKDLKFSIPLSQLAEVEERDQCPKCGHRRKLYCYDCLTQTTPRAFPEKRLRLPLRVHVVLHPNERRSKATSLQAPIVCEQGNVSVMTYPEIPACSRDSPATTLLTFPSSTSTTMGNVPNLREMTDVVFIDCTWRQSYSISHDETLMSLPSVRLNEYTTSFWRFQDKDATYLATVEAMYYFFVEYHRAVTGEPYRGEFDDLLLLYVHQYHQIQNYYKKDTKRTFTKRHREGSAYIKKDGEGEGEDDDNSKTAGPSS